MDRRAGLRIGYVPQRLAIDWTMPLTVRRLMTLTAPLSADDIDHALDAVGIRHLAGAEVQHLSGGEFQRALLARAMARKPDILVLDEPVQGVDFSGEIALYDLITSIRNATGCGILLISHDLHIVMAETDTVICLNGHVCCRGTPAAVSSSPEYMRLFGDKASRTLAVYSHDHDHTHLPDGRVLHGDGSITTIAIRKTDTITPQRAATLAVTGTMAMSTRITIMPMAMTTNITTITFMTW